MELSGKSAWRGRAFEFDSYDLACPKVSHYSWLSLIGLLNGMKTIECITY